MGADKPAPGWRVANESITKILVKIQSELQRARAEDELAASKKDNLDWAATRRVARESARVAFLAARCSELKPAPTPEEAHDLDRRLRERADTLTMPRRPAEGVVGQWTDSVDAYCLEIDAAIADAPQDSMLWRAFEALNADTAINLARSNPLQIQKEREGPATFSELKELGDFPFGLVSLELLATVEMAFVWPGVLRQWQIDTSAELATRLFLAKEIESGGKNATVASLSDAATLLRVELERLLPEARLASPLREAHELEALGLTDGAPLPVAELATFVRNHVGRTEAGALAKALRNTKPSDWAEPLRLPRALAVAVFSALVVPRLKDSQERAKRAKPVGLGRAVYDSASLVLTQGLVIQPDGAQLGLWRPNADHPNGEHQLVAWHAPAMPIAVLEGVADAAKALGHYLAWPTIDLVTEVAQRQYWERRENPHVVEFEGGWEALASELLQVSREKLHPRKRGEIRALAYALASTHVRWADGYKSSSLFMLTEPPSQNVGKGRGTNVLRFELTQRLMPVEMARLKEEARKSGRWDGVWKVPFLRPRVVPMLPGSSPNTWAPQTGFVRWLASDFTARRREISESGGVLVTPQDVRRLAARAQLPSKLADRMLPHLSGEAGVLDQKSPGRYLPKDSDARHVLEEDAEITAKMSKRAMARGKPKRQG